MRLFLAVWPDAGVVRQVEQVCHQVFGERPPGRQVRRDNYHITLQYLGQTDCDGLDCVRQAAAALRFSPFDLCLDHLGHWPRPRVVWLGCRDLPPALSGLVRDLNLDLRTCGFAAPERPYHPHLTLLRKVSQPTALPIAPIHWRVTDFVLAESLSRPSGVEYRVLERWPAQNPE